MYNLSSILCLVHREIREGIIRCILATDMARHNEILTQFREIIPIFDYSNASHKNLVSTAFVTRYFLINNDLEKRWKDDIGESL